MNTDWVVVPPAALSREALEGLIEQYVLREGTEYGARDYSLPEKVRHVSAQLEAGKAVIVYSDELSLAEIIPASKLPARQRGGKES